jgi:hypothetical protein
MGGEVFVKSEKAFDIRNVRGIAGLTAFVVLTIVLSPVESALAQWPTHDWTVFCHGPDATDLTELGDCNDASITGASSFVRAELEGASAWLDGLGFRPPSANRRGGRYVARLFASKGACHRGACDRDVLGVYHPTHRDLLVSADTSIAFDDFETPFATAVHELFHAVQYAYDSFQRQDVANWITEGTAEAVGNIWLRLRGGNPGWDDATRSYAVPLHEPESLDDAYRTEDFWVYITARHAGRNPGFIDAVFRQDLAGSGLAGVDAALRERGLGTLRDLFVDFIAYLGRNSAAVEDGAFGACAEIEVGAERSETLHVGRVAEVAVTCHEVQAEVPDSEPRWMQIRLDAPVAERRDDLVLIVGHERVQGSVFRAPVPSGQAGEYLVQVVNVADRAEHSRPLPYALEVCLTREATSECQPPEWSALATGPPVATRSLDGGHGAYRVREAGSAVYLPSTSITLPGQRALGPPWLTLVLSTHPEWMMDRHPEGGARITLHLPRFSPGELGHLTEVPVLLDLADHPGKTFFSAAEFIHDRIGEAFARGPLRTAEVNVLCHDERRVYGTFTARVLNERDIAPGMWQGPGTTDFPEAEIRLTGSFRLSTRAGQMDLADVMAAGELLAREAGLDVDLAAVLPMLEGLQRRMQTEGTDQTAPVMRETQVSPLESAPPPEPVPGIEVLATGLADPMSVAVGRNGGIHVLDLRDGGRVVGIDADGAHGEDLKLPGGRHRAPRHLVRYGDGWLVAAGAELLQLSADGEIVSLASAPPRTTWLHAVPDPATGNILVAGPSGLGRVGADGSYVPVVALQTLLGAGLGTPTAAAVRDGKTVFADSVGNLARLQQDGTAVVLARGLGMPQAMVADRAGFLVAGLSGEVLRVADDGEVSKLARGLGLLTGIAVTPGGILVTDRAQGRLLHLREDPR